MAVNPLPAYAGLVTRGVAFVIDAAILTGIAFVAGASVTLALSVFGTSLDELPIDLSAAIAGAAWVVLTVAYFAGSWTLTGQTTGMRLMTIRVVTTDGEHLQLRRALWRLAAALLAAVPFFAGYLLILVDDRRRGLHDRLAGTIVLFLTEEERAAQRGRQRRRPAAPGPSAG
jgi:uncharacterized RDD family membrane protein YckC